MIQNDFLKSARNIAAENFADLGKMESRLDAFVKNAKEKNAKLNAFLSLEADIVQNQIPNIKKLKDKKSVHELPLFGVPIAVKDNICTEGERTGCASKILDGFVSPYDASVIKKLREAGAIVFGKTNCDEFAMGSSNENSAFGAVKNPWDLSRVPGGSSGGSAAVVAGGLVPASLGSDTGGSIRQPASFCGIVGLKPTYGRLSRYGLVAFGSSLDQIGPFTRDVMDCALLTEVMSGLDPLDNTSSQAMVPKFYEELSQLENQKNRSLKGLKIGVVRDFFGEGLDEGTRKCLEQALQDYKDLGAELVDVNLPSIKYSLATYYVIATAEASANLARFDGIRYGNRVEANGYSLKDVYQKSRSQGFGREVKQRIMLGTFVLSSGYYDAYYGKAQKVRSQITHEFNNAFRKVDLLFSPTVPHTAFKVGEKSEDPLAMYLSDICTIAVNLSGIPAISIPCGFDSKGLPVGLQLMGPHFSESKLFKGAYVYEQSKQWWQKQQPKF